MTADQILQRSTHVFIGVIEKQEFQNRFLFRVAGEDSERWRIVKIKLRVEVVLRGTESRPVIDVYEAFPTGLLNGDWNSTHRNSRYLFPVRIEDGRYHLVRDFWRSIFPVYSGRHDRLPLDESSTLWERFVLLQWWVRPDHSPAFGNDHYTDPGRVFGQWREAKVLRGLFRHPDKDVRLAACEALLHLGKAQDECWDSLPSGDQIKLNRFWNALPAKSAWDQNRAFESYAHVAWDRAVGDPSLDAINLLRLLTTINNPTLRREFCEKFQYRFPGDGENGCPAARMPPETIVTEKGDVPLIGDWPKP